MANNLIQIKRSTTTATPASLANGEFAYTSNGDILYIGANGSIAAIGGKRTPGILTANQALVVNATSYVDVIKTANLYIGTTTVNAINAVANSTTLGAAANSELPTTWAVKTYVDSSIATTVTSGSTNTQVLFNDSGVIGGDAGITYNKTTDALVVAGSVNAASHTVGSAFIANSTGVYSTGVVNATSFTINTSFTANSIGITTTGFVNATSSVNSAVLSTGTTFVANSSTVNITVPVSMTGNVAIGDAATDVVSIRAVVNTDIIPSTNATYSVGNTTNRWAHVYSNVVTTTSASVSGTLTVGGDLVVTGNLTTQNVNSVVISDPIIYLAANNYATDAVDIGFAANYSPDGVQELHTGFVRKATEDKYRLFVGSTQELSGNNLVNTTATGYTTAGLVAYLQPYDTGDGFVANATHVKVTANATLNVTIAANTLTLTTALATTSGGTGLNTYTSGDILVGNSSNLLSKLSLGTSGYVLQSNGTALVYNTLDGGVF